MNNKMKKILLLAIFLVLLPLNIFAKEDYDKIDIKVGKSISAGETLKLKSKSISIYLRYSISEKNFPLIKLTFFCLNFI